MIIVTTTIQEKAGEMEVNVQYARQAARPSENEYLECILTAMREVAVHVAGKEEVTEIRRDLPKTGEAGA